MVRYRLRIQLQEYAILPGETVLGRGSSCNLTIEDPVLSREHAVLRFSQQREGGRITIRDLGSRNGTFVNGTAVHDEIELHHGDRIRLGKTEVLFSRIVTPRRDIASTGAIRSCRKCQRPFMMQAPICPHCGAERATPRQPRRSDSQQRRDWWLQLEVQLADKAMALMRFGEAEDSMRRVAEKLSELLDANKRIDARHLDEALRAAVRLARSKGAGAWIAWSLEVLRRTHRLPTAELFALLAATPPILLEEATDALQALVSDNLERPHARGRHSDPGDETRESRDEIRETRDEARDTSHGLSAVDASCLRSLVALLNELLAFRALRCDDVALRSMRATRSTEEALSA